MANMYDLWKRGQDHLAAGRYGSARAALTAAAKGALARREVAALARICLPLLESRRLMRYRAAEGRIAIVEAADLRAGLQGFLREGEGTLIVVAGRGYEEKAVKAAREVRATSWRTGRAVEALLVLRHGAGQGEGNGGEMRMVSPAAARFAYGIRAQWTSDAHAGVPASTEGDAASFPLPGLGVYDGRTGLGAVARETLLIGWEALALKWQAMHLRLAGSGAWEEVLWLWKALAVDEACEPVTMRLMAVAEGMGRRV